MSTPERGVGLQRLVQSNVTAVVLPDDPVVPTTAKWRDRARGRNERAQRRILRELADHRGVDDARIVDYCSQTSASGARPRRDRNIARCRR